MKRMWVGALLATAVLTSQACAGGECCEKAKAANGWCKKCNHGFTFGIPIRLATLHETLSPIPASGSKCPGCQKAARTNGTCDRCKISVAHGYAYKSPYAHAIARGKKLDVTKIKCQACAKVAKSGESGWCEQCRGGIVAGFGFKEKTDYERAAAALKIIKTAAEKKCEACATGMITDGRCEHCNVTFKDGKPVTS